MLLHLIGRSSKDKLTSSSEYSFVFRSLFSYWMASGLNLSVKPGRILWMASFSSDCFKMCSTQFHLSSSQFSFAGEGFFSCKWFVGDVIRAVSIHPLFNWGDLKSMFISSWGCSDVLFEGVTQYAFWSVTVFEKCIFTEISTQNKRAAAKRVQMCANLGQPCHTCTMAWQYFSIFFNNNPWAKRRTI